MQFHDVSILHFLSFHISSGSDLLYYRITLSLVEFMTFMEKVFKLLVKQRS